MKYPLPKHPEARSGEICIANTKIEYYHKIYWKTKRLGKNAYPLIKANPDRWGIDKIKEMFPVFVQETEYNEGI